MALSIDEGVLSILTQHIYHDIVTYHITYRLCLFHHQGLNIATLVISQSDKIVERTLEHRSPGKLVTRDSAA